MKAGMEEGEGMGRWRYGRGETGRGSVIKGV
jgi:hypothetical protein